MTGFINSGHSSSHNDGSDNSTNWGNKRGPAENLQDLKNNLKLGTISKAEYLTTTSDSTQFNESEAAFFLDPNKANSSDETNLLFSVSFGNVNGSKIFRDQPWQPYSNTLDNSIRLNNFFFVLSLSLLFILLFPFVYIGFQYLRNLLDRFYFKAKNLGNILNFSNLSENSYINISKVVSDYNDGKITYEHARILLIKTVIFSNEDLDLLLKEKESNDCFFRK